MQQSATILYRDAGKCDVKFFDRNSVDITGAVSKNGGAISLNKRVERPAEIGT
jgi:hypothetical protein